MKKNLIYLTIAPIDRYYIWQCQLWLDSLEKRKEDNKAVVLLFVPKGRDIPKEWYELINLFPLTKFEFIYDKDGVTNLLSVYIPILRIYCAVKYWEKHPELQNEAIFYCDSDILFTEKFDISAYIDNDVNYVSDTNSYLNATYFDSKIKDVLPEKLEEFKKIDVLQHITSICKIDREMAERNNLHSGGAQYLLKTIDVSFWKKCFGDCLNIRVYLQKINKEYFASEEKGYQSWCADMVAVLYNLWYKNAETLVIPEMDFAWSTEPISVLEKKTIFHNAGITGEDTHPYPTFYKGKYHKGDCPFNDERLKIIINDEEAKKFCNHYYLKQLLNLKNKIIWH